MLRCEISYFKTENVDLGNRGFCYDTEETSTSSGLRSQDSPVPTKGGRPYTWEKNFSRSWTQSVGLPVSVRGDYPGVVVHLTRTPLP